MMVFFFSTPLIIAFIESSLFYHCVHSWLLGLLASLSTNMGLRLYFLFFLFFQVCSLCRAVGPRVEAGTCWPQRLPQ